MFDWDDLKPFLAVARHGSTTAAARELQLDQSTVQRRITSLEGRIGQALVQRHPTGYRLTAYGESLVPFAEAVERQVSALEQRIRDSARESTGVIRLTCPEPLVQRIVQSPLLQRLHEVHPHLGVEFVTSDRYLDLAKGDADVALRSGDTDDGKLVGRKVADSLWAVYASRDYVARAGAPSTLADAAGHPWIALDASLSAHRLARWMQEAVPSARIVATSTSVLGMLHSAQAGVGVAALPTALGDAEPSLVRLFGPVPELTRVWRLLTTPALRKTARIDAFFRFVVSEPAILRSVLTG
jgi:DNA-binding transcriptional LysR family regulator